MGEGVAATELRHRVRNGALDFLEAEGFTREEASYVHAPRGYDSALDSLVAQGYLMKEAPSKKGRQCYRDIIASLEAQGFTGKGVASSGFGSISGMAYRNAGLCKYPGGCPYAIRSGGLCEHHMPTKPIMEKSDKCRSCGRVFRVDVRVIGGVCNLVVARKKAMAEKKDALGICSTPGCDGVNNRGRDKCCTCLFNRPSTPSQEV